MICVGIDIGLTGAIGSVDHIGGVRVRDMPTCPDGKGNRIDGKALIHLMRDMVPANDSVLVVFEDVRPRAMGNANAHGNSMHSQGSLMRSRGIVEAVLDILGWEVHVVQPQTWQAFYGLRGKAAKARGKGELHPSTHMARKLYPTAMPALSRVLDHNRGESLLIAHYGLKTLT